MIAAPGLAHAARGRCVPCDAARGRCAPCDAAAGELDPCAPLRLADGRLLQVSPLHPGDADAEQAFVAALSRTSRYRRFHIGWPQLPARLLAQMVNVDQQRHVALAARSAQGLIVADARYVRDADDALPGGGAEFAVAVADDWQGQGLAGQLLGRLARHAVAQGVTWLHGSVLWDNRPMVQLVHRLGGTLHTQRDDPGVLQARFSAVALRPA